MTKDEARQVLDLVCDGYLNLTHSSHFWERASQRVPELGRHGVLSIVREGQLRGDPVPDERHRNHKVRIRSTLPGHGMVEIVVAIAWLRDAVAVTIYSVEGD